MKIYYKNHNGQVLDLMKWPYMISESDVLGYEWSYTATEYTGNRSGSTISDVRKKTAKGSVKIAVSARTNQEYTSALNTLLSVTESDIMAGVPGMLYVDDYYYTCYVYGSSKKEWEGMTAFLINTLKIVSPYPYWCREISKSFLKNGATAVVERAADTYLFYPVAYPYRYSMPGNAGFINNDHYGECDFKMIIYGPCTNPVIRINGHVYEVAATLYAGEYILIDSRDHTVYRHLIDGRKQNLFNQRNKESDLFQKVPSGRCAVLWNAAAFGFDLILFQERSEPAWNLS